jgi:hypothetical protein
LRVYRRGNNQQCGDQPDDVESETHFT